MPTLARKGFFFAPALAAMAILGLAACFETAVPAPPADPDPGYLLPDSALTIDFFPFTNAACKEVLPDSFANSDHIPAGAVAVITVTSIACYAVHITIENDTTHVVVRAFDRYFGIFGRSDGDKNRGEIGYLTWDGLGDDGLPVPPGKYLWRLSFDFGAGNTVKYRALTWL